MPPGVAVKRRAPSGSDSSDKRSAVGPRARPRLARAIRRPARRRRGRVEAKLVEFGRMLDAIEIGVPQRRGRALHRAGRWRSSGSALRRRGRARRAARARAWSCRRRAGLDQRRRRRREARRASAAPAARGRGFVGEDHCGAARDGQRHRRALARCRDEFDRAAMRLDELAGQRQAEAERGIAARRCRSRGGSGRTPSSDASAAMPGPLSATVITACFVVARRRSSNILPPSSV